MSAKLGLALVGCGAISEWHRMGLREVEEIEIRAAVDLDPARAKATAESEGALPFASLDEVLERDDIDAVDLMLPHDRHEEAAVRALASGKHVLLEKPMAPDLESAERILAAAADAAGVFMVAENAQYWPEVLIARDLLQAGAIGELVTASGQLFFPPLPAYYGAKRAWRMNKAATGGGISIDTGSHYVRPLRMWMGEIDEVVASMEHPFEAMEGESLARALLRFRSGRVAAFALWLTEGPVARQDLFRLSGSRGEIVIGAGVTLVDSEHPRGVRVREQEPQGYMRSYAGQFQDFASATLRGTPLAAGPEFSLGELRTALAMERSAASRRWEKVWE